MVIKNYTMNNLIVLGHNNRPVAKLSTEGVYPVLQTTLSEEPDKDNILLPPDITINVRYVVGLSWFNLQGEKVPPPPIPTEPSLDYSFGEVWVVPREVMDYILENYFYVLPVVPHEPFMVGSVMACTSFDTTRI